MQTKDACLIQGACSSFTESLLSRTASVCAVQNPQAGVSAHALTRLGHPDQQNGFRSGVLEG
jgi:hypothetical protein